MAKYRFQCNKCKQIAEKYTAITVETVICKQCFGTMKRLFPTLGSKKVTEKVDTFLNIRQEEDHKKQLDDRRSEYFWKTEVPRLIQTYSTETCLQEGWLVYNEKGELVIGTASKKAKK